MDQRRVMLAVALSLAVVLLYNEFVVRPRQHRGEEATPPAPTQEAQGTPTPTPEAAAPAPPPKSGGYLSFDPGQESPIVVENDVFRATVTPVGGRLTSFDLKGFRRGVAADSPPLDLVEPGSLLPLTVQLGDGSSDAGVTYAPSTRALALSADAQGEVVLKGKTASGTEVEKRLRFSGNSYVFDVGVRVAGADPPTSAGLVMPRLARDGTHGSGSSARELGVIFSEGKLSEKDFTGIDTKSSSEPPKPESKAGAQWVGFSLPYFLSAVVAPETGGGTAVVELAGSTPIVMMDEKLVDGAATFKLFVGPKTRELLAAAGYDLGRTLDFGWFWFIAVPMLHALRLLHRVSGNYGVDIILLTILVRAATIPLTQKSFRSMKEMQKLQPQLKRLQEQYKDDQSRLQKEMMELYKRHNVNPFSGCAPMVLQIPIFVGLYNALLHAIELRHAPFALWITDLSAPERLMIGGIGIPVLTILMGGTMILQQWLTPQQGDPTQRQMMMIMPLVFTFMFINFPAGLVLYWLVSNILGIAQQYVMLKSPT
ncbi:MAG TPA: membrane protein insertase YidC [Candidatus Eisenbacteria bacterium]|nr:membrane protein insertase YidC [Candidatus Eisenbacteria bacterium]